MKRVIILTFVLYLLASLIACQKEENTKTMQCWNCDKKIPRPSNFCQYCGKDNTTYKSKFYEQMDEELDQGTIYDNNGTSNSDDHPSNSINHTQDNYKYKATCLSAGCDNPPNKSSSYCSEHECGIRDCTFVKSHSSDFCTLHECDSIGCENAKKDSGYYCSEHACAESGCSMEKNNGYSSLYCSWHECNEILCENRKKDHGNYCSEHECAEPYCTSNKSALSDYCYMHDD